MTWVNANIPEATVGEVLGYRKIYPIEITQLNNINQTFPFKIFHPELEHAALPEAWRYVANFQMYDFSYDISMPELCGKSLNITYVPATEYDRYLIEYYGFQNVPAYLVDMKPQLKLDGQVVAEGQAVVLGTYQVCQSSFLRPLGTSWDTNVKYVRTGAFYSVSMDHQRIPKGLFQQRSDKLEELVANLAGGRVTDEVTEEALHVTGLAYFAESNMYADLGGITSKVVWVREPSQAFITWDLLVWSFWGIPIQVQRGSIGMDVKRNVVSPTSLVNNAQDERAWMLASGSFGSAAEHDIIEQLFAIVSVSTEKIFTLANRAGILIYEINQSNINQILPLLVTSSTVKENIYNMVVNYGWTAVVPQRDIMVNQWSGQGWIVTDPATGAAGYLIAGGLVSGDAMSTAGGNGTEPILTDIGDPYASMPNPILADMSLTLRVILTGLVWEFTSALGRHGLWWMMQGVAAGLTIPGVGWFGLGLAVAVGALAACAILTYYIWTSYVIIKRRWYATKRKAIMIA